jgi:hypothetical protein
MSSNILDVAFLLAEYAREIDVMRYCEIIFKSYDESDDNPSPSAIIVSIK